MKPLSTPARAFLAITIVCGFVVLALGFYHAAWPDLGPFFCYFVLAMLASGMKIKLPGVTGTMSVIFLFILIGIHELSIAETLVISLAGTAGAVLLENPRTRPKCDSGVVQRSRACPPAVGVAAAYAYRESAGILRSSPPLMLILAATVFFVLNTALGLSTA